MRGDVTRIEQPEFLEPLEAELTEFGGDICRFRSCMKERLLNITMRKAQFIEHQIITVAKFVESGGSVKDIYSEAKISEASYANWKGGAV